MRMVGRLYLKKNIFQKFKLFFKKNSKKKIFLKKKNYFKKKIIFKKKNFQKPGMAVPSSEQKQSGRTQTDLSHGGALLGSWLISQYVSSDPS